MSFSDYNTQAGCEVIYDFDGIDDFAEHAEEQPREALSIADAFLVCRRRLHRADVGFIAGLAHTTREAVADELEGTVLFQDPEAFLKKGRWDIADGWLFREQYLSGFLPDKLRTAKHMSHRFPQRFRREVKALQKLLDDKYARQPGLEITLGAPYIPCELYASFIQTLLRLRVRPQVTFNALKSIFRIIITYQEDLRAAKENPLYNTARINAIEIITKTMNAATIKVYDERTDYYGKVIRIFNKAETYRAQEIQKRIIKAFKEYIQSSSVRMARVREAYAKLFIGFFQTPYDGSYLSFPDLNPEISLFPHQKNGVAQVLESDHNVLFAHRVGAGKTYVIVISTHELYRTGLSKKNLVVVPNNILQDFEQAHRLLYPNDRILVITPKLFNSRRAEMLEEVRDGDYTAVYMAYSSFKMVPMSKRCKLGQMARKSKISVPPRRMPRQTVSALLSKARRRKRLRSCPPSRWNMRIPRGPALTIWAWKRSLWTRRTTSRTYPSAAAPTASSECAAAAARSPTRCCKRYTTSTAPSFRRVRR